MRAEIGPGVTTGCVHMKTCLVVDDSKVIRKVARHILETLDFEVTEAGDGREALDACLESTHDVILLDWNMPVMIGKIGTASCRQRGWPSVYISVVAQS